MNEKRDGNYVEQTKQMIQIQVCDQTQLLALREKYKKGSTVILVEMDDPQAPPTGSRGVVEEVDGIGSIHCRWSNGSGLALIPGIDKFEIVEKAEDATEKRCPDCKSIVQTFGKYDINEKGQRVLSHVAMCACGKEAVSFVSDIDAMQKWKK